MWLTWNDFDRPLTAFTDVWRVLDRAMAQQGIPATRDEGRNYALFETPEHFEFRIDVPGVRRDDITLEATEQGLTLAVNRQVKVPEGYAVQRSERSGYTWKKSFALPVRIDPDRVDARLSDGLLTVKLAKAAEVQPRRISVG